MRLEATRSQGADGQIHASEAGSMGQREVRPRAASKQRFDQRAAMDMGPRLSSGAMPAWSAGQWLLGMLDGWWRRHFPNMPHACTPGRLLAGLPPDLTRGLTGVPGGGMGGASAGVVLAVRGTGHPELAGARLSSPHEEDRFELRTLDEARHLAASLAARFPDPGAAVLGLVELMVNAVEHGNLRISTAEKADLLRRGVWEEEVKRRLLLPENAVKRVRVELCREPHALTLLIRDDGPGFDWKQYFELDPARAQEPNGRGIALARQLAFPDLEYLDGGCVARIVVSTAAAAGAQRGATP